MDQYLLLYRLIRNEISQFMAAQSFIYYYYVQFCLSLSDNELHISNLSKTIAAFEFRTYKGT